MFETETELKEKGSKSITLICIMIKITKCYTKKNNKIKQSLLLMMLLKCPNLYKCDTNNKMKTLTVITISDVFCTIFSERKKNQQSQPNLT